MQSLKDTFYLMLRDRIAAGNAGRTVVVRGAVRPGVIVAENELPQASAATPETPDAFCLSWTALAIDNGGALPLTTMRCEIRYGTDGTTGSAGMDRGRLLAAMDAELAASLGPPQPQAMAKVNVVNGAPLASADGTSIFWSDVAFGPETSNGERLLRTATTEVYGYGG